MNSILLVVYLFQIQSPDAQDVQGNQQAKARKLYAVAWDSSVLKFAGFLHDLTGHLTSLCMPAEKWVVSITAHLCTSNTDFQSYRTSRIYSALQTVKLFTTRPKRAPSWLRSGRGGALSAAFHF